LPLHTCPASVQSLSDEQGWVPSNRQMLFSPNCSEWSVRAAKSRARPGGSCAVRVAEY
jgi:hypothetical protein